MRPRNRLHRLYLHHLLNIDALFTVPENHQSRQVPLMDHLLLLQSPQSLTTRIDQLHNHKMTVTRNLLHYHRIRHICSSSNPKRSLFSNPKGTTTACYLTCRCKVLPQYRALPSNRKATI